MKLCNVSDILGAIISNSSISGTVFLFLILQMSLNVKCTDSDGCAVDRARAWCEMIDTIYHRSADFLLHFGSHFQLILLAVMTLILPSLLPFF